MKKIVVVGSINMDLVTKCKRAPLGGETLFGDEFHEIPGGKGANQAAALGKLKNHVVMLGVVGNDALGCTLLSALSNAGVDTSHIERGNISSGVANIFVEENGENRILVVPGANSLVTREYIDRHIEVIKGADYLLTQLEIPLDTVEYILNLGKIHGVTTLLNPAPATVLSDKTIENCDYIIPNEAELGIITNMDTTTNPGIMDAARVLFLKGVKNLIVTLGSKGSLLINSTSEEVVDAIKVNAVDTTAAGDSYIGGLLSGMSEGLDILSSMKRGTKVASIVVTRFGAQSSLPSREEVIDYTLLTF